MSLDCSRNRRSRVCRSRSVALDGRLDQRLDKTAWATAGGRTFEEFLLQFCLGNLNLDGFVNLLGMAASMVRIVFDGGREERIDERRFSQTRFACHHDRESSTSLCDDLVPGNPSAQAAFQNGFLGAWLKNSGSSCPSTTTGVFYLWLGSFAPPGLAIYHIRCQSE